jgi:oligopeptide/dipeptide ABC transporter ATP-binding protein
VPSSSNPPSGCRFHTRCPHVMEVCRRIEPKLLGAGPGQAAACHLVNPPDANAAG